MWIAINKLLLNKAVRATLSMQNQKKITLASYGSAIHALD